MDTVCSSQDAIYLLKLIGRDRISHELIVERENVSLDGFKGDNGPFHNPIENIDNNQHLKPQFQQQFEDIPALSYAYLKEARER